MNTHSIAFQAQYFDGLNSTAYRVEVSLKGDQLILTGEHISKQMPTQSLTFSPAVGSAKAIIMLHDGAELHVADLHSYDAFCKQLKPAAIEHISRFFEIHLHYTLAALAFAGAFIFAGLRYGLPALALVIANQLPTNFEKEIGEQSLKILDGTLMSPSKLPKPHQLAIANRLQNICRKHPCPAYQLHFRASSSMGANAFALPAGDVVVTDDLVNLAKQDEEILSVLFHELGHVQHKHSLRLAVQNTGAAALLVVITGDLSAISDLAAGLPTLLMQSGYQRDMEREADTHALALLKASCIAPRHFANIMTRISEKSEPSERRKIGIANLLSSHPDTTSRIQGFQVETNCQ